MRSPTAIALIDALQEYDAASANDCSFQIDADRVIEAARKHVASLPLFPPSLAVPAEPPPQKVESLWGDDFHELCRLAMAEGDHTRRVKLATALRREADFVLAEAGKAARAAGVPRPPRRNQTGIYKGDTRFDAQATGFLDSLGITSPKTSKALAELIGDCVDAAVLVQHPLSEPEGEQRIPLPDLEKNLCHDVVCPTCGLEIRLWFNGGELDSAECCGLRYHLQATGYELRISREGRP